MRWSRASAGLLLAGLVGAQEFKGETQILNGVEGRVRITVPAKWVRQQPGGLVILKAKAPGSHGGHRLQIVREAGQSDVDKQRDRYLEFDNGKYPGAEIQKFSSPFFGYRLNHEAKNKVILRAFKTDGSDGLVVSLSSRFKFFDRYYASTNIAVLGSLSLGGGGSSAQPEAEGGERRLYDAKAIVSLVAPGAWRPLEPEEDAEILYLGLKGSRGGPSIRIVDWGGPTNPTLVVRKVAREWKRNYSSATAKLVGRDPPALLVKNRKPGWVDYVLGFEAAGTGYTLVLAVREGGFERFKAVADAMAKTVVFTDGAYVEPSDAPGDIEHEYKKSAVIHTPAELVGTAEKLGRDLSGFEKDWRRVGIGDARKKPPLHLALVDEDDFADESNGFGDRPAAYDRARCLIVLLPPPDDEQQRALWRGRLYAALAEASMHRDLDVPAPAWLRAGLAACLDAAGRTGKSPEEAHPALVDRLETKTATDRHLKLAEVLQMTHAQFLNADDATPLMHAWGYTHLMLYGGGTLRSRYRRWIKKLEKTKDKTPDLDLEGYDDAEADLKSHVSKNWGK